jgi:hypothetical protein
MRRRDFQEAFFTERLAGRRETTETLEADFLSVSSKAESRAAVSDALALATLTHATRIDGEMRDDGTVSEPRGGKEKEKRTVMVPKKAHASAEVSVRKRDLSRVGFTVVETVDAFSMLDRFFYYNTETQLNA